jgi:predicted CXXCH cytochrome family protein
LNLFPKSANALYRVALAAIAGTIVSAPIAMIAWAHTPYATGQNEPLPQPVKFDHRHHVNDNGIECLYCHSEAPRSNTAGMPATALCMGCHAQIWTNSPELALVRKSALDGEPIHWNRVNRLPDFVFFDHSVHVHDGVGCETCHGHVEQMGQVFAAKSLTMDFCVDCHRDSGHAPTHCSGCHR